MNRSMVHLVCLIGLASAVSAQVENPNVSSTFESTTSVPSAQRQRFVTPPSPFAAPQGNDLVTGNVGGMKHFRGVVPYGSTYYTRVDPVDGGSLSVDAFLRRSADPFVSDRNPGVLNPYFQPGRTVTRFARPDAAAESAFPQLPSMSASRYTQPLVLSNLPQTVNTQFRQRPLSQDVRELEELLSRQPMQEPRRPSDLLEKSDPDSDENRATLDPEMLETVRESLRRDRLINPEEEVLAELQEEHREALAQQQPVPAWERDVLAELAKSGTEEQPQSDDEEPQSRRGSKADLEGHATYRSLAKAKYAGYMQIAEEFLRQGKFYKAADTYELATLWQPEAARGYLGRSFALLAAGEYMSSAYFLSRAFELDPRLASAAFNPGGLIGDRDLFENRMIEMAGWQDKSGSGEMAFLMAYVLHQDGKGKQAADMIQKAAAVMPDDPAIAALKNVIIPTETK